MRSPRAVVAVLLFATAAAAPARPATQPASPVVVRHVVRHDPDESIFVVTVDLTDPRVSVHVAMGGPDPDGPGPYQTTLLPTSEIASREHWAVAVNGDFFAAKDTADVEGRNTGFVRGKWALALGPTIADGRRVSPAATARPALGFRADGRAAIATVAAGAPLPADITEAIGGSSLLVVNGRPVHGPKKWFDPRHPRTAVGLTQDHWHLILAVVDGRQPGLSLGLTGTELADLMADLGADVAMNLDGGGSTTLAARDGDRVRVVNRPSDGRERSVADALGVRFDGPVMLP